MKVYSQIRASNIYATSLNQLIFSVSNRVLTDSYSCLKFPHALSHLLSVVLRVQLACWLMLVTGAGVIP
jgi:hypothetical protein